MRIDTPIQHDTRLDVFRALALLTIYVNHVPGTWLEPYTHKNFGFSDSAEAFVLISGIAVGLSYGRRFEPGNRFLQTLKAWRRAAVLYITHIVATVAALAIFAAGAIWYAEPKLLEQINIGPVIEKTPEALVGIATLGHQLGYNNILPMYAALMLMVPLWLFVMRYSLRWAVVGSGLVWLAAGLLRIGPVEYPNGSIWFLNPLSWQFLFVIGMAATMHIRRGGEIGFSWVLALLSAGYLLMSVAWIKLGWWGAETALGLPMVLSEFNKTFLSLPRLLHVLALAYLVVSIPAIANLARVRASHPLAVLGRHSLPVFVAGTIISMAAQVLIFVYERSFVFDTSLLAGGIAAQFALAYWLSWLPEIGWSGKKPAARPQPREASGVLPAGEPVPVPVMRRTR
jgi:hypothetical protein